MTREVDGHSDPCTQGPPTTTEGDHHWWKMQSDANTEMKSRLNCFSSLLNFINQSNQFICQELKFATYEAKRYERLWLWTTKVVLVVGSPPLIVMNRRTSINIAW